MSKRMIIKETEQPNKKSKYDIKWEGKRKQLIEFHKIHGHYNVPRTSDYYQELYRWVSKQKHHFCKYEEDPAMSRLSAERVSLLKEMGAIDSWFPYVEESEDYSEEESEDDSEYEFEDYSEEESEDDSEDESEEDSEDESEDYSERKNSDNDINWENKLKQLIEFHKIHGHYNVPARWEEDLNLATGCTTRRRSGVITRWIRRRRR